MTSENTPPTDPVTTNLPVPTSNGACSTLITAVLLPTATCVGNELGKRTQAWLDKAKEKKAQDCKKHLENIQKRMSDAPPLIPSSHESVETLEEIGQHLDDIDPDYKELSNMWEELAKRCLQKGEFTNEMLEKLKILTPHEAAYLVKEFPPKKRHRDERDGRYITALEEKGLIKPLTWRKWLQRPWTKSFLAVMALWCIVVLLGVLILHVAPEEISEIKKEEKTYATTLVIILSFGVPVYYILFVMTTEFWIKQKSYELTLIGSLLQESGRRYMPDETAEENEASDLSGVKQEENPAPADHGSEPAG